jgi:hypothetical protein
MTPISNGCPSPDRKWTPSSTTLVGSKSAFPSKTFVESEEGASRSVRNCWGYIQGICPHTDESYRCVHPTDILPCTFSSNCRFGEIYSLMRLFVASDWDCRYEVYAVLDLATTLLPCPSLPSQTPPGRQVPNADPATGAATLPQLSHSHRRTLLVWQRTPILRLCSSSSSRCHLPSHLWRKRSSSHTTRRMQARYAITAPPRPRLRCSARPHPLSSCDCATRPESRPRPAWPRRKARWLYLGFLGWKFMRDVRVALTSPSC